VTVHPSPPGNVPFFSPPDRHRRQRDNSPRSPILSMVHQCGFRHPKRRVFLRRKHHYATDVGDIDGGLAARAVGEGGVIGVIPAHAWGRRTNPISGFLQKPFPSRRMESNNPPECHRAGCPRGMAHEWTLGHSFTIPLVKPVIVSARGSANSITRGGRRGGSTRPRKLDVPFARGIGRRVPDPCVRNVCEKNWS